jgi:hypothetical protein
LYLIPLSALCVYVATLYPGVPGGDSGEFIVAGSTLGVAHPPGYPLYLLLVKIATLLPFGAVAWRVNLLSGILDAAAVYLIALSVARWSSNRWAGILAGGLFAFSFPVWDDATRSEVFALNNFFAASLLYIAVLRTDSPRSLLRRLAILVFALGLTNQHTFLFFGAPFVFWILWEDRREVHHPREVVLLLVLFLAGLLPYFYLPLASLRPTPAQWGNQDSLSGFLAHVLRLEYGTFQLTEQNTAGDSYFLPGLWLYLGNSFRLLLGVGMAAAVVGLGKQLDSAKYKRLALATIASFLLYIFFFNLLANLPLNRAIFLAARSRFWQQSDLLLCVWAGLGVAAWAPKLKKALPAIVMGSLLVPVIFGWKSHNHHSDWIVNDYAMSILSSAPRDSIIIVNGDLLSNSLRYLHVVEKIRPDVTILPKYALTRSWIRPMMPSLYPAVRAPTGQGGFLVRDIIESNIGFAPIWICGEPVLDLPASVRSAPYGICDGLEKSDGPFDFDLWSKENEKAQLQFRNSPSENIISGDWDSALRDYWESLQRRANFIFKVAAERNHDPALLGRAIVIYEKIASGEPRPPASLFKNMGLAYYFLTPSHPEYRERWRSSWIKYLALAPAGEKARAKIQRAVTGDGVLIEPLD